MGKKSALPQKSVQWKIKNSIWLIALLLVLVLIIFYYVFEAEYEIEYLLGISLFGWCPDVLLLYAAIWGVSLAVYRQKEMLWMGIGDLLWGQLTVIVHGQYGFSNLMFWREFFDVPFLYALMYWFGVLANSVLAVHIWKRFLKQRAYVETEGYKKEHETEQEEKRKRIVRALSEGRNPEHVGEKRRNAGSDSSAWNAAAREKRKK